jgi:predicted Fe-Mo cluster-binding NifX family protein
VQAELGALYVPPVWRPDDPAVLHGLVLGARSDIRSLARSGVQIAGRAWADLGGGEGYYAVALLLEGAARVVLVDEDSPRPLALALLEQAGVEVVVGDARSVRLTAVDALLALYSIDPGRVLHSHRRIQTAVVAPARDPWGPSALPAPRGFRTRVARWSTRLLMGEGACALADCEGDVEVAVHERVV